MTSKRRLSNIRLTRHFHFRHLGLWVVATIALVLMLNGLLYVLLAQQLGYAAAFDGNAGSSLHTIIVTALLIETLLFCVGIVFMAMATSHRIAGAFLSMEQTCRRIQRGEHAVRQTFRTYDGLDTLEKAFNGMVDSLLKDKS